MSDSNGIKQKLQERVKELNGLYALLNVINKPGATVEKVFQTLLDLIPPAWQYPEITAARIIFEGKEYKTNNFQDTEWKQSSIIVVDDEIMGSIEVCYLQQQVEDYEGPFLKEERNLIEGLKQQLVNFIKRSKAESVAKEYTEELEKLNQFMTDREDRMIELKQEVDELRTKLNLPTKYGYL